MFTRRLISSFLSLSILVFPAAFLRDLISVVVNICLSLLVSGQFSLWYSRVGGEYRLYDLCLGRHGDFFVPKYS